MDINLLIKSLLRKSWLILLITVLAGVLSFFLTKNMELQYKSTAQLSTGFTQRSEINLTDERFSLYEADVKFSNLIENLKSRVVLAQLSYKLLMHDLTNEPFRELDPEENRGLYNGIGTKRDRIVKILQNKNDSLKLLSTTIPEELAILNLIKSYRYDYETLLTKIYVSRIKRTDYVEIIAFTENPVLSAYIVNMLVDEYFRFNSSLRAERSNFSVDFLSNLVDSKKKLLDSKTDNLERFKRTNNLLDVEIESESRINQISLYEIEKNDINSNIRNLQISIKNINNRINELTSSNNPTENNTSILDIQNKIDVLNEKYVQSNFTDAQLLDSISILREKKQLELAKISGQTKGSANKRINDLLIEKNEKETELEIARESHSSIENQLSLLKNNVSAFASKEATYAALKREVDLATQEYLDAQERFNTAQNQALLKESTVKQVLLGQPASEPETSRRFILIGLSMAASFAMTFVILILLEFVDFRLKTGTIFKQFTNLKLLGVLNEINTKKYSLEKVFNQDKPEARIDRFKHLLRKIRYEINTTQAKVFLFTSTKKGEGKTFTLLSLAFSFSLIQKKILIIDTNFRNNSLSKNLILNNKNPKYLLGSNGSQPQEAAGGDNNCKNENYKNTPIISPTKFSGIDIIGNNGLNLSPSEAMVGKDFQNLLDTLSHKYDFIFLEGSALNEYSDSKELIEYADRVIGVFSSQSVIKSIDKESITFITNLNSKFLGGILNKVEYKFIDA